MTAALLGTGLPPNDPDVGQSALVPSNIVGAGPIRLGDLHLDFEVSLTAPSPT